MTSDSPIWVGKIPGDPIPFRRAVRDAKGNVLRVLRFEDDTPLALSDDDFQFVRSDIGRTLCFVNPVDPENSRFIVDWETTSKQFRSVHGYELPSRPIKPVNVALPSRQNVSPIINADEVDTEPDDRSGDAEESIELSDVLLQLIERHADSFVEATPDGIREFLNEGGKLEALEGFTQALADELRLALSIEPDLSRLIAAGMDTELAQKLGANVKDASTIWLLDPVAIRAKLAEGFKLEELDEIGKVSAKKIREKVEGKVVGSR